MSRFSKGLLISTSPPPPKPRGAGKGWVGRRVKGTLRNLSSLNCSDLLRKSLVCLFMFGRGGGVSLWGRRKKKSIVPPTSPAAYENHLRRSPLGRCREESPGGAEEEEETTLSPPPFTTHFFSFPQYDESLPPLALAVSAAGGFSDV